MRGKRIGHVLSLLLSCRVSLCKLLLISELIKFWVKIVLEFFFFVVGCCGLRPPFARFLCSSIRISLVSKLTLIHWLRV
jgi:hypothetical protein